MNVGCATPQREVYGKFSKQVVHLTNGDSVQLQARVAAVGQGPSPGIMFVFYPFQDLSDTHRLRRTAVALFLYVRPELDSAPPPFVVLRAVDLPAERRVGFYKIHNHGFVVERRGDGVWYLLGESQPIR